MKTISEVFKEQNRTRFSALKQKHFDFIIAYLEYNQNKEFHAFHHDLNRVFLDNKPEILNEVVYEYEAVCPNKKNIGVVQEFISNVFNEFKKQG